MEPAIVFLGTAGDVHAVSKQMRGSGGIILRADDLQFHIDPGPGSLTMAKIWGINPRETSVVLVSHNHVGHNNDLNACVHAMTLNGMDTRGVVVAPVSVIEGENGQGASLSPYHKKLVEKVIIAAPDKRIGIQDVDILPLMTKHPEPHGVGYKIMTTRFVLTYSGDTAFSKELLELYAGTDILILNTVFPRGCAAETENLTMEDAVKIVESVKPTLCILTHFGKQMLAVDPLQEARELQILTGVQVIAARDGQVINPYSYSAESRQKSLKQFQGK